MSTEDRIKALEAGGGWQPGQTIWLPDRGDMPQGLDAQDRRAYKETLRTVKTVDEGKSEFFAMSDAERSKLGLDLFKAGVISDPNQLKSAWDSAVSYSAGFFEVGKKVTPYDVLTMWKQRSIEDGGSTKTSVSYNAPSAEDAKAGVRAVFEGAVGRAPTAAEVARYTAVMTSVAHANPTRTTVTYDANGNSTSSSSGGVSSAGLGEAVRGKVEDTSEFGAYQAATTYMDALQQMLGL